MINKSNIIQMFETFQNKYHKTNSKSFDISNNKIPTHLVLYNY